MHSPWDWGQCLANCVIKYQSLKSNISKTKPYKKQNKKELLILLGFKLFTSHICLQVYILILSPFDCYLTLNTQLVPFRPSIFCWSPVSSRVYQSTNQTLPSIPGINFGCYWKTTSVHCQGLPLISQM